MHDNEMTILHARSVNSLRRIKFLHPEKQPRRDRSCGSGLGERNFKATFTNAAVVLLVVVRNGSEETYSRRARRKVKSLTAVRTSCECA